MANKVGPLIKEARVNANLTQEQLAKQIEGISAADISKAERGELQLTQLTLKTIAKITGVSQNSLIEAAKKSTYGPSTTKPATTTNKKTTTTSSNKKTTTTTNKKTTSSSSSSSLTLTATEKKLVELYRAASSEDKKKAMAILKGEKSDGEELLNTLLNGAMGLLNNKK